MRYEIDWYTDAGVKLGVIQAFTSLEYVRTENSIGNMVLTIPRGLMRYEDFAVGQLFEIWREKHGSLELQNDTAYLQDWQFYTDRGQRIHPTLCYRCELVAGHSYRLGLCWQRTS